MSERTAAERFLDAAATLLRRVRDEEVAAIGHAADLVADATAGDGRIFVCGAGHSALPAQDVVYRAGGLAVVNLLAIPGAVGVDTVPAPLGSALEQVHGLAAAVLDSSPARAGDVLFVISLSGRNPLPVELARHRGLTVVGVTSVRYAETTTPRHPSGTFLRDHCDVVLDSKVAVGDAELVLSLVGAAAAERALAGAVGALSPDALFADMNTGSPAAKRGLAETVAGTGAAFALRGAAAGGRVLRRVASPLLMVAFWQLASSAGLISPRTLASPASIAKWRLSWQVTPIWTCGPSKSRASRASPSDWPRWTPSAPSRFARLTLSLTMNDTSASAQIR